MYGTVFSNKCTSQCIYNPLIKPDTICSITTNKKICIYIYKDIKVKCSQCSQCSQARSQPRRGHTANSGHKHPRSYGGVRIAIPIVHYLCYLRLPQELMIDTHNTREYNMLKIKYQTYRYDNSDSVFLWITRFSPKSVKTVKRGSKKLTVVAYAEEWNTTGVWTAKRI